MSFRIVAKEPRHDDEIVAAWEANYGGTTVVSRGREYDARKLAGLVAENEDGHPFGALTWHRDGGEIEIVSLDSFMENRGVGTALLNAAAERAREMGVSRLWLITSNDNTHAIRYYQKRGWNLCALHRDAVEQSRKLKPSIPLLGDDGIPVRHEIEFELQL